MKCKVCHGTFRASSCDKYMRAVMLLKTDSELKKVSKDLSHVLDMLMESLLKDPEEDDQQLGQIQETSTLSVIGEAVSMSVDVGVNDDIDDVTPVTPPCSSLLSSQDLYQPEVLKPLPRYPLNIEHQACSKCDRLAVTVENLQKQILDQNNNIYQLHSRLYQSLEEKFRGSLKEADSWDSCLTICQSADLNKLINLPMTPKSDHDSPGIDKHKKSKDLSHVLDMLMESLLKDPEEDDQQLGQIQETSTLSVIGEAVSMSVDVGVNDDIDDVTPVTPPCSSTPVLSRLYQPEVLKPLPRYPLNIEHQACSKCDRLAVTVENLQKQILDQNNNIYQLHSRLYQSLEEKFRGSLKKADSWDSCLTICQSADLNKLINLPMTPKSDHDSPGIDKHKRHRHLETDAGSSTEAKDQPVFRVKNDEMTNQHHEHV
ncbi:unnamed protein product [Mytilus coruscus]|uniref:Uncharacterized protein n=1 Tax=Mytilus coruscus TaxID=42192 RepID=A0A6J8A9V3_MYTCO|nr:unnamed protein product [Mytilus coruscus]